MPLPRRTLALAALALLAACATPPDHPGFHGRLTAGAELPPTQAKGTGDIRVTLDRDTRVMTYTLNFANLSGPAIAAHFHAPAGPAEKAGIRVALVGVATSPGPITGQIGLTPDEAADLLAGRWYVNIHTANNADGEIRGQLIPD